MIAATVTTLALSVLPIGPIRELPIEVVPIDAPTLIEPLPVEVPVVPAPVTPTPVPPVAETPVEAPPVVVPPVETPVETPPVVVPPVTVPPVEVPPVQLPVEVVKEPKPETQRPVDTVRERDRILVVIQKQQADARAQERRRFLNGYKFCGVRRHRTTGLTSILALKMNCRTAIRNAKRVKYTKAGKPRRAGYNCRVVATLPEFIDVRCTKRGSKVKFRYQTAR